MLAEAILAITIRPTQPPTTPIWSTPLTCHHIVLVETLHKNTGRDPHGKHTTYVWRRCDGSTFTTTGGS